MPNILPWQDIVIIIVSERHRDDSPGLVYGVKIHDFCTLMDRKSLRTGRYQNNMHCVIMGQFKANKIPRKNVQCIKLSSDSIFFGSFAPVTPSVKVRKTIKGDLEVECSEWRAKQPFWKLGHNVPNVLTSYCVSIHTINKKICIPFYSDSLNKLVWSRLRNISG